MRKCVMSWLQKIFDRRTIVSIIALALLSTLAFRNISPATAIDGMVLVVVALTGSNAAQRSLIAWTKNRKNTKPTKGE